MIFESRNRFKPASMKAEFRTQRLDLGRFDELRMADHNAIQWPFKLFLPERQELDQNRKIRRDIIVLPDIGLQQARMIWQMIKISAVASPYPASCLIKSGDGLFVSILVFAVITLTSAVTPAGGLPRTVQAPGRRQTVPNSIQCVSY